MAMAMMKRECPFCGSTNVTEWTMREAIKLGREKDYTPDSLFCYDCESVLKPKQLY